VRPDQVDREQGSLDLEQPVYARAIRKNSGSAIFITLDPVNMGRWGRLERALHSIPVALPAGLCVGLIVE
jgi:hypothetical protein